MTCKRSSSSLRRMLAPRSSDGGSDVEAEGGSKEAQSHTRDRWHHHELVS
jgi:hypothetical protein